MSDSNTLRVIKNNLHVDLCNNKQLKEFYDTCQNRQMAMYQEGRVDYIKKMLGIIENVEKHNEA